MSLEDFGRETFFLSHLKVSLDPLWFDFRSIPVTLIEFFMSDAQFVSLSQVLTNLADIPAEEAARLYEIGKKKSVKKGELFIRSGEVPGKFAFVHSGLFRYLYTNEEGKQFTKGFMPQFLFLSSYSAMIQNTPSWFCIEALEDSLIIEFDYHSWMELKASSFHWDRFLIAMLERGYTIKETRERELLLLDAESRYKIFLDRYPGLEQRVKQHMIASYLGVTPESLSRIRKKIHH
ncbi:Crp/Fnr family transcriptional regulator [Balneolaceae bacterium ANBcel3]|nr:Crp/Fnr family transcriptional regulator [Balneolaceae bacterium ANBcel3]